MWVGCCGCVCLCVRLPQPGQQQVTVCAHAWFLCAVVRAYVSGCFKPASNMCVCNCGWAAVGGAGVLVSVGGLLWWWLGLHAWVAVCTAVQPASAGMSQPGQQQVGVSVADAPLSASRSWAACVATVRPGTQQLVAAIALLDTRAAAAAAAAAGSVPACSGTDDESD